MNAALPNRTASNLPPGCLSTDLPDAAPEVDPADAYDDERDAAYDAWRDGDL
jgi:hypothetical protein